MAMDEKEILRDRIIQVLRTIYDPEIPVNIWDMGLIYKIDINDDYFVLIQMTLTAPNCPVAEDLPQMVEQSVKEVDGVNNVQVQLTFEPSWDISMMSDEAKFELNLI
ncbi:MAG: SUF system Fe-S cluster assembly protein [Bacteroidales bacterium]